MHCGANDRLWQAQNISHSLGMSATSLKQPIVSFQVLI
jgi:hypothetical protein